MTQRLNTIHSYIEKKANKNKYKQAKKIKID